MKRMHTKKEIENIADAQIEENTINIVNDAITDGDIQVGTKLYNHFIEIYDDDTTDILIKVISAESQAYSKTNVLDIFGSSKVISVISVRDDNNAIDYFNITALNWDGGAFECKGMSLESGVYELTQATIDIPNLDDFTIDDVVTEI